MYSFNAGIPVHKPSVKSINESNLANKQTNNQTNILKQVNDYQFTNPVPVQMRGVVMAELAAVRVYTM